MKKILFIILILSLFSCGKSESEQNLDEGISQFREGNYKAAAEIFSQLLEDKKIGYKANLYYGISRFSLGDTLTAVKYTEKSVKLNPKYSKGYHTLGNLYYMENKIENSEKCFVKSLEIDPENQDALNDLLTIYLNSYRYNEAIEFLSKMLSKDPNNLLLLLQRGTFYYQIKEYNKALADYEKTDSLEENYLGVRFQIANTLSELNRDEEALKIFSELVKENESNHLYVYNRGLLYRKMGRFEKSEQDLKTALELKQDFYGAYIELGNTQLQLSKRERASKLGIKPQDLDLNLIMPEELLSDSDLNDEALLKAFTYYNNAVSINSDQALGFIGRSIVQRCLGRLDESEKELIKAEKTGKESGIIYNLRGLLKYSSGDLDSALVYFEDGADTDTGNIYSFLNRGIILYELGDLEESMIEIEGVKENFPDIFLTYYYSEKINRSLGRNKEADEDLKKLRELGYKK